VNAPADDACDRWERYWSEIGNEQWLAARELLDLSPRVRNLFATFVAVEDRWGDGHAELQLDWEAAAAQAERDGLSSTEYHLARLVAALTTGQPIDLVSLSWMGSWQGEVWRVLVQWGTDGAWTTAPGTGMTPARRAATRLAERARSTQ